MSELKPCPFCGGGKRQRQGDPWEGFFIVCLDCAAAGPREDSIEAAISSWNTRRISKADVEKGAIAAHEYQHVMPWSKITRQRRIETILRTEASLHAMGFEVDDD